ncbi:MAG: hypothetical protein J5896_06055 [Alphaproteobacteria bacterium]|nr:hypothetical protein [Alphaproteobacteria bacterium]
MNTFIWGFSERWRSIIDDLAKENVLTPRFWIFDIQKNDATGDIHYANKYFFFSDKWLTVYADRIKKYTEGVQFNAKVYDKVYQQLYHYMDCESRHEKRKIYPFHYYINEFNLIYNFVYAVFVKENIKLCLLCDLPHVGLDIIAYHIAKAMGIKTFIFKQSMVAGNYFGVCYMTDEDDYGIFDFMKEKFRDSNQKIEKKKTEDLFNMKNVNKISYKMLKRYFPWKRKYAPFREYKRTLKALIEPADYAKKYVYFPLHLQPEGSTTALGGIYCDQLLALEKLASIVPDDCLIYVKENPKQTEKMRGKHFFERLRLMDKVRLVPLDESSYKLMINSLAVATISGTVGWEAICEGKPAILFGKSWYQSFDGVFKWRDALDFNEVINYKIDFQKIENQYNDLISRMPKTVISDDYLKGIPDFNEKESCENMKNLIKRLVLEK